MNLVLTLHSLCRTLWGEEKPCNLCVNTKKQIRFTTGEDRKTYENFVNAHLEVAAECIPAKQRAKPRVPLETLAVRKKHADVKTAFKCNKKNPTNINALKLTYT